MPVQEGAPTTASELAAAPHNLSQLTDQDNEVSKLRRNNRCATIGANGPPLKWGQDRTSGLAQSSARCRSEVTLGGIAVKVGYGPSAGAAPQWGKSGKMMTGIAPATRAGANRS
ncbi:hypothetical protein ABIF81_002359 [Bradyrhizobium daqingense]